MRNLFGVVAIGVGLVLIFGATYGIQFAAAGICAAGPYPNPAIPVGSTMTTNGGLIGYFVGSTFVPYNGYLSGEQVVNGVATACTTPTSTTTTSSTTTTTSTSTTTMGGGQFGGLFISQIIGALFVGIGAISFVAKRPKER